MTFMKDTYWLQKRAQSLLGKLTGSRLHIFEKAKHGIDDMSDLAGAMSPVETIFDVGGNTGQSAIRFRAAFPAAKIFSFEPVSATFRQLQTRTRGLDITCCNLALGHENTLATMYLSDVSLCNTLIKPDDRSATATEQVQVKTLDSVAGEFGIDRIDFLKIDAEGADMDVLRGAATMLSRGGIKFVMVETGFDPEENIHGLFEHQRDHLKTFGFRVFGIYGQTLEWSGEPKLKFANTMFCHSSVQRQR